MRLAFTPYTLDFKAPAGTSRGVLHHKKTYLLKLWDEHSPERYGIGEASVFEGLSKEAGPRYEYKLIETLANVALGRSTDLTDYPSIQFGLEQAILDLTNGCRGVYYPSKFTEGEQAITINGLVWMGKIEEMLERLDEKLAQGFRCIKLKIGAIDFAQELRMLRIIRERHPVDKLEIRVDANGGFNMENVIAALHELSKFQVHSIEQPIPAGHWDLMQFLCQISPVPIALDEELIGINTSERKEQLITSIRPKYLVLKPSLCGGFSGSVEWMELAVKHGIGYWVTSALESNVGLNALAQWVATLTAQQPEGLQTYQGLGTGALYTNNFPSPLTLNGDQLTLDPSLLPVPREPFDALEWRE